MFASVLGLYLAFSLESSGLGTAAWVVVVLASTLATSDSGLEFDGLALQLLAPRASVVVGTFPIWLEPCSILFPILFHRGNEQTDKHTYIFTLKK